MVLFTRMTDKRLQRYKDSCVPRGIWAYTFSCDADMLEELSRIHAKARLTLERILRDVNFLSLYLAQRHRVTYEKSITVHASDIRKGRISLERIFCRERPILCDCWASHSPGGSYPTSVHLKPVNNGRGRTKLVFATRNQPLGRRF